MFVQKWSVVAVGACRATVWKRSAFPALRAGAKKSRKGFPFRPDGGVVPCRC